MRILAILSLLFVLACSRAEAGHSQNNGTCDDDKTHYENMTVNGKRSDAPLYAKSQTLYKLALESNSVWQCENLVEEALRMIRKTDGEYPTE
jgi:hypothetical protein|tara:strand:+ start:616 stop:891 length:276 start_codon:yes stop_codon:yes gene_type:complete